MTANNETALSSGSELKDELRATFGDNSSGANTIIDGHLAQKYVTALVQDAATAGTAVTESLIWRNSTGGNVKVVAAYFTAPIAVTAGASNNATITLAQRDSAGANSLTIAAGTTTSGGTGSLTAFLPVALTLTAANQVVANGAVLTLAISKGASGVALTAATSYATLTVVYEPV